MKLSPFYGTWRIITAFTKACHLSLILIQINPVHALLLCSLQDTSLIFKECLSPHFHCAVETIPWQFPIKPFFPFLFCILAKKSRHINRIPCKLIYIQFHYNTMNREYTFSTKTSWVYTSRKEEDMGRWWLKSRKTPAGSEKDVSFCSFRPEHTCLHLYYTLTSKLHLPFCIKIAAAFSRTTGISFH